MYHEQAAKGRCRAYPLEILVESEQSLDGPCLASWACKEMFEVFVGVLTCVAESRIVSSPGGQSFAQRKVTVYQLAQEGTVSKCKVMESRPMSGPMDQVDSLVSPRVSSFEIS